MTEDSQQLDSSLNDHLGPLNGVHYIVLDLRMMSMYIVKSHHDICIGGVQY